MTRKQFYVPVSLEPVQNLVGGIPRGSPVALVGPPEAGKTTLSAQCAIEVALADKGNLLVFDTENTTHTYRELLPRFEERFKTPLNLVILRPRMKNRGNKSKPDWEVVWDSEEGKVEKDCLNIIVVQCPDITPITAIHGRGASISISPESGKVKVALMAGAQAEVIDDAPVVQLIQKHNIAAVVYDSITNPLDEIPAVGENFPARADLTQIWMIQVQKVAARMNIPILATFHESKNDTSPFSKGLKVEGGKGVSYNLKFVVYVQKEKEMGLLPSVAPKPPSFPYEVRLLWNMRHPRERAWTRFVGAEMTDQGFVAYTNFNET